MINRIKLFLFLFLAMFSCSFSAFADYYWKGANGTYIRLDPSRANFLSELFFRQPQIDPATIPSNVIWNWNAQDSRTGYWIGHVPASSGPSQEEIRRAETARQAEAARQAELARQAEIKRVLARDALAKTELEVKGAEEEAKIRDKAHILAEQRRIAQQRHRASVMAEIEAQTARTKAMAAAFCFPGETPVSVKDENSNNYTHKPISTVRVGDSVVTCNLSVTHGICEFGEVQAVIESTAERLLTLTYADQTLRTTENHPFYVVNKKAWVNADDLAVGDLLYSISGTVVPLERIDVQDGIFKVYNLDVKGNHNYYACDVLVHNCNSLAAGTVTPVGAVGAVLGAAALAEAVPAAVFVGSAAAADYALHEAMKAADGEKSKRFTDEQQSLIDMAKKDKKTGITEDDMKAYKDLNRELGNKGFPKDRVRGPEEHPDRAFGKEPHGHVGPVNHIPVKPVTK